MKRILELEEGQQWRRRGRKSNMEGERGLLEVSEKKKRGFGFFIKKGFFSFSFQKANATCPILNGAKRAHIFL